MAEKQTFSDAGFYFEYYTVADYDALAAQDEVHWKTRRTLLARIEALEAALQSVGASPFSPGIWLHKVNAALGSELETSAQREGKS